MHLFVINDVVWSLKKLIFSFVSELGKHQNGDARTKKPSVTESVHSKTRFSDSGDEAT